MGCGGGSANGSRAGDSKASGSRGKPVLRVLAPCVVGCGFAGYCGGRSDPHAGSVPLGGPRCPPIRLEGEVQESPDRPRLRADLLPSARPGVRSPRICLCISCLLFCFETSLPSSPPAFALENGSEGERLPVALRLKDGKVLATFPAPPPPEEESLEVEAGPCKWPDSKRFRRAQAQGLACKTQSDHLQSYRSRCCQPESEGFGRAGPACHIQVIVGTE